MNHSFFIKTYGCQMNVYDSERMAEALGSEGYVETKTPDNADMILLNTCHIREKAAEKIYSELGRYKGFKAQNPDLKIGVAVLWKQLSRQFGAVRLNRFELICWNNFSFISAQHSIVYRSIHGSYERN